MNVKEEVDHSRVSRWFKKLRSVYKSLTDQARAKKKKKNHGFRRCATSYSGESIEFFLLCFFSILTIFTNPSARAEYDTRSLFKRSLTGLNSEFSFS